MNWTGGKLSRHSRASGSLTAQQKQHFAKVQTIHRNGAKHKSPLKWSILGNIVEDRRQQSASVEPARRRSRERSFFVLPEESTEGMQSAKHGRRLSHESQDERYRVKVEPGYTPKDDLYDATPEPPNRKRRREASPKQVEAEEDEGDPIVEKRRRLLNKPNWVGITAPNPIRFVFASPTHGDKVGRRRKVTDGHKARYSSRQSRLPSPFALKIRQHSPQYPDRQDYRRERGKSDVRISIGGRVVPPGISSSSAPSRHRTHSAHTQLLETCVASSDVMLLDNDNGFAPAQIRKQDTLKIKGYSHRKDRRREGNDTVEEDFPKKSSQHQSSHIATSSTQDISPENDSLIFSSSSVSMQHPKPRTSQVSVLLRSSSSDLANSTTAHVGKPKPVVPSSQVLDNKIWESWAGAQEDNHDNVDSQSWAIEEQLSPGVSMANCIDRDGAAKIFSHQTPPLRVDSASNLSSHRTATPSLETADLVADGAEMSNQMSPSEVALSVQDRSQRDQAMIDKELEDILENSEFRQSPSLEPTAPDKSHPKSNYIPDPDELWKRFVFDDSDEKEFNEDHKSRLISAVRVKALPPSSLIMNTSGSGPPSQPITSSRSSRSWVYHERDENYSFPTTRGPGTNSEPASDQRLDHRTSDWQSQGRDPKSPHTQSPVKRFHGDPFLSSSSVRTHDSIIVNPDSSLGDSTSTRPPPTSIVEQSRKVLFTRPKPFVGTKSGTVVAQKDPLHIGRRLPGERDWNVSKKTREHDTYSLPSSTSDEESIEDT